VSVAASPVDPHGHDEVHALRELPAHERAQRGLVDLRRPP
jgi:hypothetical protein